MSLGPGDSEPSQFRGGEAPGSALLAPAHKVTLRQVNSPPVTQGNPSQVTFDRTELSRLFGLYGRKVAAGEWRDYAIDFLKDRAVFSVFRRPARCLSTGSRRIRGSPAGRAPIA